ncbi:uncharacterized protein LOC131954163 [Physella acuta]|uniref:uncharacterized protein LOC131954163 n=1 Tax=Physella acuta TaxID=109671 RepID=UPI0027DB2BE5|nr:uncharacterized protein LOC131954163 [Physella acuta]
MWSLDRTFETMALIDLVLLIGQAVLVTSFPRPHLTIHLASPASVSPPESRDIRIEDKWENTISRGICRAPGNKITFRLSPGDSATDLMDESVALTSRSVGAQQCTPTTLPDPVSCKNGKFCSQGNNCTITIISVCPGFESKSSWDMTEAIDVTIGLVNGDVVLSSCFAVCQSTADAVLPSQGRGLPEAAVGVIVAGVIVLAAVIVGVAILCITRRSGIVNRTNEKLHYMEYAR